MRFPEIFNRELNLACRWLAIHLLLYYQYSLSYLFKKDYVTIFIHSCYYFLPIIISIHEHRVQILIEWVEEFHIVRFKFKVKHLTVFLNPSLMYWFWDHDDIMLQDPTYQDLRWCFIITLCQLYDIWMVESLSSRQWAIRLKLNFIILTEP